MGKQPTKPSKLEEQVTTSNLFTKQLQPKPRKRSNNKNQQQQQQRNNSNQKKNE